MDPPNDADPDKAIDRVKENDQSFIDLNWNNIKVIIYLGLSCYKDTNIKDYK